MVDGDLWKALLLEANQHLKGQDRQACQKQFEMRQEFWNFNNG